MQSPEVGCVLCRKRKEPTAAGGSEGGTVGVGRSEGGRGRAGPGPGNNLARSRRQQVPRKPVLLAREVPRPRQGGDPPSGAQRIFSSSARGPVPAICGAHQQVQLDAVRVPGEERGAHSEAAEDQ